MLLDYAAELKCQTQRQLVNTGAALINLPQNLHQLINNLSQQAHSICLSLAAELHDLRTRKKEKLKKKERLGRTKQQLIQATKLIRQAESLNHTISNAQSINQSIDQEEKTEMESDPKADQEKVDRLSEQIRQLKEQMSLFETLKQSRSSENESDHCTDDESVPIAPPIDQPISQPISQPINQPNTNQPAKVDRNSQHFPSIPIASPMFAAVIPTAPALSPSYSSTIPDAPSIDQSVNQSVNQPDAPMIDQSINQSVREIPTAPMMCDVPSPPPMTDFAMPPIAPVLSTNQPINHPMSPATPSRVILSEVSNVKSPSLKPMRQSVNQSLKPRSVTDELSSRPPLRPRARPSAVQTRKTSSQEDFLAPPNQSVSCYTREIPGTENMSHNDLIKVAAKIKLRRTEIPRSPGGTPARKAPKLGHSGGVDQAILAQALSIKFRDLHRYSVGSRNEDKENDWATD